jgi:hypothetical protein
VAVLGSQLLPMFIKTKKTKSLTNSLSLSKGPFFPSNFCTGPSSFSKHFIDYFKFMKLVIIPILVVALFVVGQCEKNYTDFVLKLKDNIKN